MIRLNGLKRFTATWPAGQKLRKDFNAEVAERKTERFIQDQEKNAETAENGE